MSISRKTCTATECDKPSRARDLCWAHYNKQLRAEKGAVSRDLNPDPRERIAGRSTLSDSGCWEWQRVRDRDGYGITHFGGKRVRAHRLSYEAHIGPIPAGLTIDHLCRNTCCVNPLHLEAVTNEENVRRARESRAFEQRG